MKAKLIDITKHTEDLLARLSWEDDLRDDTLDSMVTVASLVEKNKQHLDIKDSK